MQYPRPSMRHHPLTLQAIRILRTLPQQQPALQARCEKNRYLCQKLPRLLLIRTSVRRQLLPCCSSPPEHRPSKSNCSTRSMFVLTMRDQFTVIVMSDAGVKTKCSAAGVIGTAGNQRSLHQTADVYGSRTNVQHRWASAATLWPTGSETIPSRTDPSQPLTTAPRSSCWGTNRADIAGARLAQNGSALIL